MSNSEPALRVFLSYAREDQELVETLYQKLSSAGFKPWMDTVDILPGEIWMESIRSAIEQSDFFIACLSRNSISKRGVLQKELRSALDTWQGMLESDIYFIPIRLDNCDVPHSLTKFQWVDLYEQDGYSRLESSLREGSERRKAGLSSVRLHPSQMRGYKDKPQLGDVFKYSVQAARERPVRFMSSILGLIVVVTIFPWLFNNYFYKVDRPILPDTCQISPEPVRVGLTRLSGCSPSFQDQLAADWMGDSVVTTIIPQVLTESVPARQLTNYDIVVWGACESSSDEAADLSFELVTSRKPYGIYEPSNLQVSGNLNNLSSAGRALMSYQHGDYSDAAILFDTLYTLNNSTALLLFKANSLLYAERYGDAIAAYEDAIKAEDINSAASFNNMGVAYFNQNTNQGLEQLDQSINLAKDLKIFAIEALALLNRSEYHRVNGEWEYSLNDCKSLFQLNGQSALPYFCLASYNYTHYRLQPPGLNSLNEINRNLTDAAKYEDVPVLLDYLRGNWYVSHFWKEKLNAVDSYLGYLKKMEYRACLKNDRGYVTNAKEQILGLTRP